MLNLGEKDGFDVVNLDGYAGHISYGDQKEYVGTIGHLDVVPLVMTGLILLMELKSMITKCMVVVLKMIKDLPSQFIML